MIRPRERLPMLPNRCDVAVVGGGPAGSICSILLARRGFHVVLVSEGDSPVSTFPETLAPSSLRLLEGLGLPIDYLTAGARPCRRIETAWDSSASDLIEVEWLRCRPGMSIDRNAFDRGLLSLAKSAGVNLVAGRATQINVPPQGTVTLEVDILGRATTVECRILIEATGRRGILSTPRLARRHYFDQLIAIARRVSGAGAVDHEQLRIVATENGWWYFAEHPRDGLTAVFLTDGDLFCDRANGELLESRLRDELRATALPFSIVPAEKGAGRHVVPGRTHFVSPDAWTWRLATDRRRRLHNRPAFRLRSEHCDPLGRRRCEGSDRIPAHQ